MPAVLQTTALESKLNDMQDKELIPSPIFSVTGPLGFDMLLICFLLAGVRLQAESCEALRNIATLLASARGFKYNGARGVREVITVIIHLSL